LSRGVVIHRTSRRIRAIINVPLRADSKPVIVCSHRRRSVRHFKIANEKFRDGVKASLERRQS
jgi:hypothetical protein